MHTPSAQVLLEIVERGAQQSPAYRALLLLNGAFPEATLEHLATLPIGTRNRHLLLLRKRLFGGELASVADCPECREALELSLHTDDLLMDVTDETSWHKRIAGYSLSFRLPNSLDLLNLPTEAEHARGYLLERCVTEVRRGGRAVEVSALPNKVLEALSQRLAEADPQAVLDLDLTCPACGHRWRVPLDIASFLWRELEHWAGRSLLEVHQLARAYGWPEADILGMSPWRRQAYLALMS